MESADKLMGKVRFLSWPLLCGVLVLLLPRRVQALNSHELNYSLMSECGVDKVLKRENRYRQLTAFTPLHCALLCADDFSCKSFDYNDGRNLCYLGSVGVSHKNCEELVSPDPSDGALHYASVSPCSDGKELQPDKTCKCPKGFGQEGCRTRMQDCSDYKGYLEGGKNSVKWIWPTNTDEPFQVFCNEVGAKVRTMLMVNGQDDSSESIFKTAGWQDYKNGFGSFAGDHWLGLERMHLLTTSSNRTYKLRFKVTWTDHLNETIRIEYFTYKMHVGDEGSQYALSTLPVLFPGTGFADCLYPDLNGAPFSTWDRNNDHSNCSTVFGAGFWFNETASCAQCNPTGRILLPPFNETDRPSDAVFWSNSKNAHISHAEFYLLMDGFVLDWIDPSNGTRDVWYTSYKVHVGDEDSGYTISTFPAHPHSSTFADCLYPDLNDVPFSTWDNSNDHRNCSSVFGGGFWFNATANCAQCNPTGRIVLLPFNGTDLPSDAVFWNNNRNVHITRFLLFLLRI